MQCRKFKRSSGQCLCARLLKVKQTSDIDSALHNSFLLAACVLSGHTEIVRELSLASEAAVVDINVNARSAHRMTALHAGGLIACVSGMRSAADQMHKRANDCFPVPSNGWHVLISYCSLQSRPHGNRETAAQRRGH